MNISIPFEIPVLIIACGGKSERMGIDKFKLNYFGKPQYLYLKELLSPYFSDIYFSIAKSQIQTFSNIKNVIVDSDKFEGHGPISGLLSCHETIKNRSILFIGCDYPKVNKEDIMKLVQSGNPTTSYFIDYYEPMLALYNYNDLNLLEIDFIENNFSLRKFLEKIKAIKILTDFPEKFQSVDTPEEYRKILLEIKES